MKKFKSKKIFFSFLILFLIGLALGLFFIYYISETDKIILSKEFEEYFYLYDKGSFNYFKGFLDSFKINFTYLTIIWSSGILFLFFPIVYFIVFYKGFLIGFLISSFISIYKIKGILYSFIFIFPHEIINVVLLFMISVISIKFARKIFMKAKNNESINLKVLYKKYTLTYLVFTLLFLLSSLLEIFLNSFLIKIVI